MKNVVELDYYDTKRAIRMLFDGDVSVILKSPPGQGKSSMMAEIAEENGPDYGLFEINGALANQPDFAGWFYRCTETYADYDGKEITVEAGRYTFPHFGFDKRNGRPWFSYKKGAIVIEEYGQTDVDLKRAFGQTTLEKRVGQHVIPKGFDIIMLSNYEGGRDAVTRDFDFLINRRAELHFRNDIDNWLIYGYRVSLLNVTMAFASLPVHKVFAAEIPKDQGPFLTPRSLDELDSFMQVVFGTKGIDISKDPVVRVTASGIVGAGTAHQYIAFASLRDKIPSIDQIIKSPTTTSVPTATDQQMFLVFNMADKADKKTVRPMVEYLHRLPSDMAVAFYKNALTRDKALMSCREFGDWAVKNKGLLAVVNSRI